MFTWYPATFPDPNKREYELEDACRVNLTNHEYIIIIQKKVLQKCS